MPNENSRTWNRFDSKAHLYGQFRRPYPEDINKWFSLFIETKIGPVLDLGAGTGLLSRALAAAGFDVAAVEPSDKMRTVGIEETLEFHDRINWHKGSSIKTGLPDNSVHGVVMGDVVHWLELDQILLKELNRVAVSDKCPVLIFKTQFWEDPLGSKLHDLLSNHKSVERRQSKKYSQNFIVEKLFRSGTHQTKMYRYNQKYTFDELYGRLLSDSHVIDHDLILTTKLKEDIYELVCSHNRSDKNIVLEHKCSLDTGLLKS